jgi:alkaline phosphatase
MSYEKSKFLLLIVLLFFSLYSISQAKTTSSEVKKSEKPKNIILLIGDGMGVGHVSAYYLANTNSSFAKFKKIGLVSTYAYGNEFVTDSAAGGTALSTGNKTRNGFIAMSPDGEYLETVSEVAKKNGKVNGIVVTCTVTHATPAVFYSHVSSRANENQIATFLTNGTIDFVVGGGLSYFSSKSKSSLTDTSTNESESEYSKMYPSDAPNQEVDLLSIMASKGYVIVTNYNEFKNLDTKTFKKVLALLEPNHLPSALSGRKISLGEMLEKGLEVLSKNKKGFFIMVEGSQIDWESHGNNAKGIMAEMNDFDSAINVALEFAKTNGETLVIVTADHETGGVGVIGGVVNKSTTLRFVSKDHTAELVPIFSYGPGSELFEGIIDNTYIGQTLKKLVSE